MEGYNEEILITTLVLILGLAVAGFSGSSGGSVSNRNPDEYSARIIANKFVENRLKAPATAYFASILILL